MDIHCYDAIHANRFEYLREISCRDRIAKFGSGVLSRITQVGHDGRQACSAGVLDCTDKEKQPAQFVVDAVLSIAMQHLDDVHVFVANAF